MRAYLWNIYAKEPSWSYGPNSSNNRRSEDECMKILYFYYISGSMTLASEAPGVVEKLIDHWNVGIHEGTFIGDCASDIIKRHMRKAGLVVCLDYD